MDVLPLKTMDVLPLKTTDVLKKENSFISSIMLSTTW